MLRVSLRVWMGVCVSAAGAEKVTPVANVRRNGNWYIIAVRRCESKQSRGGDESSPLLPARL